MFTRKWFVSRPNSISPRRTRRPGRADENFNSGISRSWYYRLSKVFAACANPTIEILRQRFPAPSRQDVKFEIWSSDLRAFGSLREIFRFSIAVLAPWDLGG